MSDKKITGVVKDAALLANGCLYGTLVVDYLGRFDAGNWIRTSKVVKIKGELVYTLNSVYKVEGGIDLEANPSVYNLI